MTVIDKGLQRMTFEKSTILIEFSIHSLSLSYILSFTFLDFNKLMRMAFSSFLKSTHCIVVDQEHDKIEKAYIMSVRVKPKRKHSFVDHSPLRN